MVLISAIVAITRGLPPSCRYPAVMKLPENPEIETARHRLRWQIELCIFVIIGVSIAISVYHMKLTGADASMGGPINLLIFMVGFGAIGAGLIMESFAFRATRHPSKHVKEEGIWIKLGDTNPDLYDAVGVRYMHAAKKWFVIVQVIAVGGALLIVVLSYFI